jgi:hypothetical protein
MPQSTRRQRCDDATISFSAGCIEMGRSRELRVSPKDWRRGEEFAHSEQRRPAAFARYDISDPPHGGHGFGEFAQ